MRLRRTSNRDMLLCVEIGHRHGTQSDGLRVVILSLVLAAAVVGTAHAADPRVDEPGRRILIGMEWTTLLPVGEFYDPVNTALVPSFTAGYADVLTEGFNAHLGIGYWYVTGRNNPIEGVNIFPVYAEIEYAPLRGTVAEAGISLQGGAVRTDLRRSGPGEWERRLDGLAWYGFGAAGPVFTLELGSFVRLQTGARWTMLLQPRGITSWVGIPLGIRVRL